MKMAMAADNYTVEGNVTLDNVTLDKWKGVASGTRLEE